MSEAETIKRSESHLALENLKVFCPLCYEYECQKTEADRGYKALTKTKAFCEWKEAKKELLKLRNAHPKCKRCSLLFGKQHLGVDQGDGECQYCAKEIESERILEPQRC